MESVTAVEKVYRDAIIWTLFHQKVAKQTFEKYLGLHKAQTQTHTHRHTI